MLVAQEKFCHADQEQAGAEHSCQPIAVCVILSGYKMLVDCPGRQKTGDHHQEVDTNPDQIFPVATFSLGFCPALP